MRALSLAGVVAIALGAIGCPPSPCQELTATWKQCWCDGATPSTSRSQETIDRICASDQAFLADSDSPVPEPERLAIERCDETDAEWARGRIEASECRAGGSYVCGSARADDVCSPPA